MTSRFPETPNDLAEVPWNINETDGEKYSSKIEVRMEIDNEFGIKIIEKSQAKKSHSYS